MHVILALSAVNKDPENRTSETFCCLFAHDFLVPFIVVARTLYEPKKHHLDIVSLPGP